MEKIKLNFLLKSKAMSVMEFITYCKCLMIELQGFDAIYKSPNIINLQDNTSYSFREDLSDFNLKNLFSNLNDEDISYKNENDNDITLNANSKSWIGFSLIMFFGKNEDIFSIPDLSFTISQGSYEDKLGSIEIEYSEKYQKKLTKEYIIKLIKLIEQNTELIFANSITNKWFLKVRQRGQKTIGWLNYLNRNIAYLLLKNELIMITEKGTLFCLSDKKTFMEQNENLIERAKELSNKIK